MVMIITGATHTGKTVTAQKLVERKKFPCLSMDLLKMGLIRSGNTRLGPTDDKEMEDYLWPIVVEIIKTAVENGQNLIVEGCYVPSGWKDSFPQRYLDEIRFICIVMSEQYILRCFDEIKAHACDIENRVDDSSCTRELLIRENRRYLDMCLSAGLKPILIDSREKAEQFYGKALL